jgi:molybdate transport repressor ModE-like protein
MFDPRHLDALVAVVDSGSVSAGARALGVSQPTISHHVARLEAQLGMAVLVRNSRGAQPTLAGARLAEHARDAIELERVTEQALTDLRDGRTGRVAVSAFPTALVDLVPRAVRAVNRQERGVVVDVATAARDVAVQDVLEGRSDAAVVFADAASPSPRLPDALVAVHLLDDPMLVVLPRRHRLSAQPEIPLEDLSGERWVLGTATGPDAIIGRALASVGIATNDVFRTDDLLAMQGLVANGMAVSLCPSTAIAHARPGIVLRSVTAPALVRRIELVTRRGAGPTVDRLTDALLASAAELG